MGIFAAPSISAAEKKEAESVEANREVVFSEALLAPGGTIAGYLFFESPFPLKKIEQLELELGVSGDRRNAVSIQLSNPYREPEEGELTK